MPEIGVITNPNSTKNRNRPHRVDRLGEVLGPWGLVCRTGSVEAIAPALQEFLHRDIRFWVSDGGDGTLHWILNEGRNIVQDPSLLPPLVPTNGGAIDFIAKKAGIVGQAEDILTRMRAQCEGRAPLKTVEVGTLDVQGEDLEGRPFRRLGFASAIAGIGQRFFDKYYSSGHRGGPAIVKVVALTVASSAAHALGLAPLLPPWLQSYAPEIFSSPQGRVAIDGKMFPYRTLANIHAGAVDINLGGVFRFFPLAADLGRLHFHAGAAGPWQIIKNLPRMFLGLSMNCLDFWEGEGRTMEVEADPGFELAPVIDGEIYPGLSRLTVTQGPAVRILAVPPRIS